MSKYQIEGLFYFDVEYGNSESFYSGVKSKSLPYEINALDKYREYSFNWNGFLAKTKVVITDDIYLDDTMIKRSLKFNIMDDSSIFDLVSRFVVYSKNNRAAEISGNVIEHRCSNLYYQFPADKLLNVPVGDDQYMHFSSSGGEIPKGFDEVFYIRDEAVIDGCYRWIVHHRLVAKPHKAKLIVRSCHPRFEGVLPCQYLMPKFLKKYLYRIRERKFPNFPIMCVGEVGLKKGEFAVLSTCVEVK